LGGYLTVEGSSLFTQVLYFQSGKSLWLGSIQDGERVAPVDVNSLTVGWEEAAEDIIVIHVGEGRERCQCIEFSDIKGENWLY
jgi:hypothetical protein